MAIKSVASLKLLKSFAHGLAHQFASTLNYRHDDYAIIHLARIFVVFTGGSLLIVCRLIVIIS